MKKTLFVISASGRYNFGDLLFNYIVKFYLGKELASDYNINYVSLMGGDLRKIQGHKTISLKCMNKKMKNGDVLIYAGGGLLGHRWTPMFYQHYNNYLVKVANKIVGNGNFEKILKFVVFRQKYLYPFTVSKMCFNKDVKVIYNSVGGGALLNINNKELKVICSRIFKADYLAVRDIDIYSTLKKCIDIEKMVLSPDSAILMSELYNKEDLLDKASNSIKKITYGEYIVLHFNEYIARKYRDEINELIYYIKNKLNYNVVLLPINFINNTDSKGYDEYVNTDYCRIMDCKINLFEICTIIAHSKLLIGSSLHANIISASYGIPHLGFTKEVRKVNYFFKTWYEDNNIYNSYCIEDLKNVILSAIKNNSYIIEKSNYLRLKAKGSFNSINRIINENR